MSARTTTEVLHDLNTSAQLPTVSRLLMNLAAHYAVWQRNYATRKQLARLSEYELDDIGLSQSDAIHEARRPFFHL